MLKPSTLLFLLLAFPGLSKALAVPPLFQNAVDYVVTLDPRSKMAQVKVTLSEIKSKVFHMAAWQPGDYDLENYGKAVESIRFYAGEKLIDSDKKGKNTWELDEPVDSVVYTVKESNGNFSPNLHFARSGQFVCGTGVFGWFDGAINRPGIVSFEVIRPGLPDPVPLSRVNFSDYFELIDTPHTFGGVTVNQRAGDGTNVIIKALGTNEQTARKFLPVCRAAFDQAHKLMKVRAFSEYTFHLEFGGQGGGLEHANATRIGLGGSNPEANAGIIFHELFHAYNVKRIRPKSLVEPDLTKPVVIDSLWWLEGVTDYYADVLQVRAGYMETDDFWHQIGRNYGIRREMGRNNLTSALVSSQRVWDQDGSNGYNGNYYEKGYLIGAILDMQIRLKTENKKSLDDVIRALYQASLKGGYKESAIRELCISVGGKEMGPIYDDLVTKPEVSDWSALFAEFGRYYDELNLLPLSESSGAKMKSSDYPLAITGSNLNRWIIWNEFATATANG